MFENLNQHFAWKPLTVANGDLWTPELWVPDQNEKTEMEKTKADICKLNLRLFSVLMSEAGSFGGSQGAVMQ